MRTEEEGKGEAEEKASIETKDAFICAEEDMCGETPCTCFSGSANSRVTGAQTDRKTHFVFCCISDEPANALPRLCTQQESTCSSAVQGQSSVFCFLIGSVEMCCNKGRTSVRSLLCNIEMSHVACGVIT